jgi:hypothetical protein
MLYAMMITMVMGITMAINTLMALGVKVASLFWVSWSVAVAVRESGAFMVGWAYYRW